MTTLSDKIRRECPYQGSARHEQRIWNAAIEAACKVVDANTPVVQTPSKPLMKQAPIKKVEEDDDRT